MNSKKSKLATAERGELDVTLPTNVSGLVIEVEIQKVSVPPNLLDFLTI